MTILDIFFGKNVSPPPPPTCPDITDVVFNGIIPVLIDCIAYAISPNGTILITVEYISAENYLFKQYNLLTPYSIQTAVFSGTSIQVPGELSDPYSAIVAGLALSPDGTKLYVISTSELSQIYQYNMSTPFDLSTIDLVSFPVLTSGGNFGYGGYNVIIGDSGSKLYFLTSQTPPVIRQYTLSTPYDTTTYAYDNLSLTLPAGTQSFELSTDGLKLFISNVSTEALQQYTIGTAWNISTAVYNGDPFPRLSVASQDTNPFSGTFNNDGTKFFITGDTNNIVVQYTLSTPYIIATAGSPVTLNVSSLSGSAPRGVSFDNTGLKMYVSNNSGTSASTYIGNALYEYTLTAPYTITGATLSGEKVPAFYYGATTSTSRDIVFSSDGLNYYITQTGIIYQFTLSVAWRVSTAVYSGKSLNISAITAYNRSLVFDNTGTVLTICGIYTASQYTTSAALFKLNLSVAWDISTATFTGTALPIYSIISQLTDYRDIWFKPDLSIMYVCDGGTDVIYQYTLGTPGNITTATYASKSLSASAQTTLAINFCLSDDGTKAYVLGYNNSTIFQYTLGTPWDLSTGSYSGKSLLLTAQVTNPESIEFSADGLSLFVGKNNIWRYTLGTAWDISTATYTSVFSSWGLPTSPLVSGLRFSTDGLNMYIMNTDTTGGSVNTGYIQQYTLSVAYDLTTASYTGYRYYARGWDSQMRGIYLTSDNTRIYQGGSSIDRVYMFTMATAGNLSTLLWRGTNSVSIKSFNTTTNIGNTCIRWDSSGNNLFVIDTGSTRLIRLTTTTPYDINSLTNVISSTLNTGGSVEYFSFNSTGSKLYVAYTGATPNTIREYGLGTPFDLSTAVLGSSLSLSPSTYFGTPIGVFVDPTNTKIYVDNDSYNVIHEFRMTTPSTITTASYTAPGVLPLTGGPSQSGVSGSVVSSDGYTVFALYQSRNVVSYTLSTPFDLSTATQTHVLSTTSQTTTTSECLGISANGVNLLVGDNNRNIYRYVLSVPWNLSTATYSGDFLTQTSWGIPTGATYNSDGTKFYVTDWTNDYVYQYILTTPYQINNAIYGGMDIWVPTQFTNLKSFKFDNSGNKLYALDDSGFSETSGNGRLYSYNLGTPYNINTIDTLTYTSYAQFYNVGNIASAIGVSDQYVRSDGSVAYILGTNTRIYRVNLNQPYEIGTSTYGGATFNASGQSISTITFSPNGLNMYGLNISSNIIHQYTLSVAWDITTAATLSSFNISAQDSAMRDFEFSSDGLRLFAVGRTNDRVYQYNLSSAFVLSSAVYSGTFLSISAQDTDANSINLGDSGTKLYIFGSLTQRRLLQYDLSTPWDISSATFSGKNTVLSPATDITRVTLSSDGTRLYGGANIVVLQRMFDVPWDASTVLPSVWGTERGGFGLSSDGGSLYLSVSDNIINQFTLNVPYDITTAVYSGNRLVSSTYPFYTVNYGFNFNGDGSLVTLVNYNSSFSSFYLTTHYLTTSWDISTAILGKPRARTLNGLYPPDSTLKLSGIENIQGTNNLVLRYNSESSPAIFTIMVTTTTIDGDISTISVTNNSYITGINYNQLTNESEDSGSQQLWIRWGDSGSKIFSNSLGTGYTQYRYITAATTLPYETTHITPTGYIFSYSSFFSTTDIEGGFIFNGSGTRLYLIDGTGGSIVYQVNLTTPWDIRTCSYSGLSFNFSAQIPTSAKSNVYIKPDGSTLYIISATTSILYEYNLGVPGEINSAVYSGNTLNFNSYGITAALFTFSDDGLNLYTTSESYPTYPIAQFLLSVAWDITTATLTYSSPASSLLSDDLVYSQIMSISSTGDKVLMVYLRNKVVFGNLTTPYDISTLYVDRIYKNFGLNQDASKLYTSSNTYGSPIDLLRQYSMSVPGNFDTLTRDSETAPYYVDGKLYVIDNNTSLTALDVDNDNVINEFIFSTPGNISTITPVLIPTDKYETGVSYSQTIAFNPEGTILYYTGYYDDLILQFDLTVPWDINSVESTGVSLVPTNPYPLGISFSSDGTKMFVLTAEFAPGILEEYALSTPWLITSATLTGNTYDFIVDDFDVYVDEVRWSPDGLKMYVVVGYAEQLIVQYTTLLPYDLSTLSRNFDLTVPPPYNDYPISLTFLCDGNKCFVLNYFSTIGIQYNLSTAYDLSSAVYTGLFKDFSADAEIGLYVTQTFYVKNGNDKLYLMGNYNDTILVEYDILI